MSFGKLAVFAAGVLFGTAGVKLLSSKDAKKVYAHTRPQQFCVQRTAL